MRGYLIFVVFLILIGSALAVVDSDINFENETEISVIIILNEEPTQNFGALNKKDFLDEKKAKVRQQQDQVLGRLKSGGFSVNNKKEKFHRFSTISAFAGKITPDEFEQLKSDPGVKDIFLDRTFSISLNDSAPLINADNANSLIQDYSINLTGAGQTVCVIDTGIDYNHTSLGGGWGNRVLAGYDYYNSDSDPMDDNGHGTHVAGIIASSDSTFKGVAPEANLVALKACDSTGNTCTGAAMASSIDWCNNNSATYNISVISMSIGDSGQYNSSNCPSSLDSFINTAHSLGIVFVVSSGNDNYKNGISYPACSPNATSVGSVAKDDTIPSYSNSGSLLDLLAPGGTSSVPIRSLNDGGGYANMYGTSMAAPHVSGAAALLNQYKKIIFSATYTPDEIESILKGTGLNKTDTNSIITPRIDIYAALQSVDNTTPSAPYISPTPANNSQTPYNYITVKINASETVNATLEVDSANYSMSLVSQTIYQATATNLSKASHTFKVYLVDTGSNSAQLATRTFAVNNSAPNITSYTPSSLSQTMLKNNTLFFNQTSLDAENNSLSYYWYLNNTLNSTNSSWTFSPGNNAGTYPIILNVSDGILNSTVTWSVVVRDNSAPITNIVLPANNAVLELGNSNSFTTNTTDPDSDSLIYLWDFGDSSTSSQANTTHQYLSVSNFSVSLNTTDPYNASSSDSINVSVTDTTDPVFNSITYSSSIYTGSNLAVTANITDYSTIANVTLTYNGSTIGKTSSTNPYAWTIIPLSNGSNSFTIQATDAYSNSDTDSYSFTVNYCGDSTCQSQESCSSCSADCGTCSGGSSGSSSTTSSEPSQTTSQVFIYPVLSAGTAYDFNLDQQRMPFTQIKFMPKTTLINVRVEVSTTNSPPKEIEGAYSYLEITHQNIDNADISSPTITFRVNRTWLEQNSYNPQKVSLYRYSDNQWNKLTTSSLRNDFSYYHYQAVSPGFSYFAVVAEEKIVPAAAEPEVQELAAEPGFGVTAAAQENLLQSSAVISNQTSQSLSLGSSWYYLLIVPGLIVLIFVISFFKKKHSSRPKTQKDLTVQEEIPKKLY